MEVIDHGETVFSTDVWNSFQMLHKKGYLDPEKKCDDEVVFLDQQDIGTSSFTSIYDLNQLNHSEMAEFRKIARMTEEDSFLLPLEEHERLHRCFLDGNDPGASY